MGFPEESDVKAPEAFCYLFGAFFCHFHRLGKEEDILKASQEKSRYLRHFEITQHIIFRGLITGEWGRQ